MKLLNNSTTGGIDIYHRPDNSMWKAALWVSFWMWLLSAGSPDIIDQVVRILGTFA